MQRKTGAPLLENTVAVVVLLPFCRQQSSYYEFTKTYLIQTGVLGVLTVRINAPSIDDADYRTVITGHYEIINSSGTAFSLWNTGQTAGSGSLALEDSGLTNWAIVNPTGSTGKPNAHITDVSNGHQLYEIYDWFGSTETSLLPGFYAKLVTKNNVETQSRNIRPGLTFELRCDSMDFYYSDSSDSIKGSTAVAATTGVQCKLSNQPGIFGNGSSLPDGESVVLGWEGIISTRPTPISPVARAGSDFEVIDADDSGAELVTLDGSASYDPNGEIVSYVWTIDDAVVATGEQPQINLPVGLHIITLTVTDNEDAMNSAQVAVSVRSANGYTWYIDYDGGDDNNDGRSPSSPFKRCPGDANATGQAASTVLSPGDRIIFKGGVIYRGHITANWSGLSQVPIRYDGNTAGTFGTGRAIIDGSEILTGWTACQSANDCDGNPNWQHIYYTYLPAGVTAFSANLSENDDMLWLAQDPNQPDPFFFDRVDTYVTYDSATTSTIRCDSYFTSSDPDYWNGWTYVLVWAAPNNVYPRRVTAYNPSTHTITYDALGSAPYDPGKFAMCNSLKLLDTPGEYVVREDQTNGLGGVKVYLWPLTAGVSGKTFTVSTRKYIFSLGSQSHISIEGFILQKASSGLGEGDNAGSAIRNSGTASSIWIVDNEIRHNKSPSQQPTIGLRSVTDCLVDSNFIQNNCSNRGMILSNCTYSSIRNNILWRNGSTAIDYYGACNSDVSFNIVSEHFGCHANGISIYLNSSNVMVFGNAVYDSNIALTAEKSTNITLAYNTFHTATGLYTVALWGNTDGVAVHNNVIQNIGKPGSALAVNSLNNINITVRNNILDGCNIIYHNAGTTEYNIYTSLNWTQKERYGWQLGTGELLGAAADLFTDPLNFDYHLKDGAAAIDAGTDLGYQQDKDGNPVPANGVVDIGSYEKQ